MNDSKYALCQPPAFFVCAGSECRCELPPATPLPLPEVCLPPKLLTCVTGQCTCIPDHRPPVVDQPAGPIDPDGCTLLLAVVVAGVKKSLLACWVG